MYWDAKSLCGMIRTLSTITSVGVLNSITMVCEGELVKRLEFEALIGQMVKLSYCVGSFSY